MLSNLQDRNEREIRKEKSRIYKEMLDNQIYLNQQYRRRQKEKLDSSFKTHQKTKPKQRRQSSYDGPRSEEQTHKMGSRPTHLPVLQDKNTYYRGYSNYSKPQPSKRAEPKSRVRTYQIEEQTEDQSEESEEVEDILSQIKILNKKLGKSKQQLKHKRLSILGASARRAHREREASLQIEQRSVEEAAPHHITVTPKNDTPHRKRYTEENSAADSYRHGLAQVQLNHMLYHSPKHDRQPLSTFRALDEANKQSLSPQVGSGSSLIEKQRERFVHILRKVKNRGQSLYLKLSRFPNEKQ